ncbi:MAG: hypothetical protein ACD_12C00206G0010 [uncultured bacterium]|nr:MAG: hypothetical protein ACD_12C00206G0010 [uncultured bacterium]
MLEGSLTAGETMMMAGVTPPHVEVRPPQGDNSTSLSGKQFYENQINPQKYEAPTIAGVESYTEPTTTRAAEMPEIPEEIPDDLKKILLDIQSGVKKPEDKSSIANHEDKTIQTENQKKPWSWSIEDIKNFFKNFFIQIKNEVR